jgi:hypothetical protein
MRPSSRSTKKILARLQALLAARCPGRMSSTPTSEAITTSPSLVTIVARGAQAVAVEHRADLAAVGEGDRGRPVPGLHQERVVLVVGARSGPCRPGSPTPPGSSSGSLRAARGRRGTRNSSALSKRAESLASSLHDRIELLEVVRRTAPSHRALARVHPVLVALDRVDLAVVGDVPEGLREVPGAEGVGAVARVHEAIADVEGRIDEIREEGGIWARSACPCTRRCGSTGSGRRRRPPLRLRTCFSAARRIT